MRYDVARDMKVICKRFGFEGQNIRTIRDKTLVFDQPGPPTRTSKRRIDGLMPIRYRIGRIGNVAVELVRRTFGRFERELFAGVEVQFAFRDILTRRPRVE